jgi:hypothetical protein
MTIKFIAIFKTMEYNRRFYSNCFNRSLEKWKIKSSDTVVLAAFGSGFTWEVLRHR